MKTNSSAYKADPAPLSVSHKAVPGSMVSLHDLPDAVLQTDLHFNITGWNNAAEQLHGRPGAMGKNLFELIRVDFIDSSVEKIKADLQQKRSWEGEVVFHRYNNETFYFRSTVNYILNEKEEPVAIIIVNHNITRNKNTEKKLAEAENIYHKLVNTLVDGVVMINADGKIGACNKRAAAILGLTEEELLGRVTASPSWNAIKPDGSPFPLGEFPAIVSLQTGFPQRNVKMGIKQPNDTLVWISINSEALIRPGEFEPYAAVVSFSDITDAVDREEELRKSNERFFYTSKITSDAIWDIDLITNEIYRSEAFCQLSGYNREDIQPNLDWWFDKVHPQDRVRVKNKVDEYIKKGTERWEDEYRFMCADGSYKFLLDTGIILYRQGQPVRLLGAIRDLTEKKKLENQLLHEQKQRQQAIGQASISVQEQERNDISRELHDNVNQILMSAKLFLNSALREPEKAEECIKKANEYQMMAVEEIRQISKRLNSSIVKAVGLKQSIKDIAENISTLQSIETVFTFDDKLEEILTYQLKLTIYRIIQEQTNNIIKYAQAGKINILLTEAEGNICLTVSDNGKGFNPDLQTKGIGLINIYSRADAYNGDVKLISSPGRGCSLEVSFPLK